MKRTTRLCDELEEDRAAIERVNAMIDTGRVTVLERLGPCSFRGSIRDGVIVSPSNPDAEPGKVATIFESTTFETEEDK